jgi:hypothetical protein
MRSICTPSVRFPLPAGGAMLIWFPSRSGGDLSERGTITEFSNSLTPSLDNPQKMVYNGTDRYCVARNAQNTDKLLEGG